jgi:hypothetical protein
MLIEAMFHHSKLRVTAIAGVLLAAVALVAVIIHRLTPRPDHSSRMVEMAKPAKPSAATAVSMVSAADWMDKIRHTPAAARSRLMREILSISDENLRNEIATALAIDWLSTDVDGYLAFLDSIRVDEGLTSDTMQRFAPALMSSFETVAGGRPTEGKIHYVAELIVDYLISTNIARAGEWAREFQTGLEMDTSLARIAPAMVSTSPEKGMEIFAGIMSVSPRLTAASELGVALANRDAGMALSWANALTANGERTMAMESVTATIAKTNPSLAASQLKTFLDRIQTEYLQRREKDRQQAGLKLEDEFQTPELYQEYLDANGYVQMQPDTPEADYLLKASEKIGFQLATTDPSGAISWAESLVVGIAQAHAINGALSGWSLAAPREALNYYLQHYGDDAGMALAMFENWAGKDALSAAGAIQDLQNDGQKSSAIRGVTNGWLESGDNIDGLIDWVARLPAGVDRDTANLAIIAETSHRDPAAAWELVMKITEPGTRSRSAKEVFAQLALDNPGPAQSLLDRYEAPADEIEALRRILSVAENTGD